MPIQAEFEEKTYETYFGHEMARLVRYAYSPGQAAEAYLGFDAAYHLFWDELPWPYLPFWSQTLREDLGYSLHDWTTILEKHFSRVPDAKFNLFVQFKRPERIIGHRGTEWTIWRAPYYRYQIREHQQNILSALDEHSGSRATVIYASPACIDLRTLFRLSTENQIISKSNIALVENLHNHNRYTYVAPGSNGVACSEPEAIEGPTFDAIIEGALRSEPLPYVEHLLWTSRMIEESMKEQETRDTLEAGRVAILARFGATERPVEPNTLMHALLTMSAFSDISNSRLLFIF